MQRKLDKIINSFYNFTVSFVAGLLAAFLVVNLYNTYIRPQPRFYQFNLSDVLKEEETKILKNKNVDMKKEINAFMELMRQYVDYYAKDGIVFVGGATIGDSPYIKDITSEFVKEWRKRKDY